MCASFHFLLTLIIIAVYIQIAIWDIAQISVNVFMQIDETDIIYIIVYNSWTTENVYNAAQRRSEPF